jgi:hypothetical protein
MGPIEVGNRNVINVEKESCVRFTKYVHGIEKLSILQTFLHFSESNARFRLSIRDGVALPPFFTPDAHNRSLAGLLLKKILASSGFLL